MLKDQEPKPSRDLLPYPDITLIIKENQPGSHDTLFST